ncbi:DUF3672 domain-containing protein [Aeromonas sp. SG16]|uniref:DUF3672 domain-containing protein n=1 Tax=Aeromonas sp. SG16 TaxID=2950548 RepID=UPI002108953D|nr:DUF3672 domain-containing protein [Aeromonas sp. SG16]MCQ4052363.1 DUF3672 domain-containing protein [Aeromonas sp. SG16]
MSGASFRASNTQQGLTENMQILTGQKGDRLDKALTLREAAELGMVNLRRNGSGQIVPELPPDKPTDPEWSGVQQPVAPTGVTADGAFHTITLTWDIPAYKGHSYAEILRAEVDNPSSAVAIGTTLANVYSDAVGKGFSAFYWVRFVNKNGMVGPLHSTDGLHAATSPDVDEIVASATNFAIYNPAKPNEKEIVFGVTDDGKVAIREAVIKAATIQIIHSEKITADYIKAGVSISAPLITGGQIDMGNAFMSGGSAGFGKGGPYAAWGWGWYTMIYADGSVYTNRLRAEGGYVRNMTIGNCTIEQDCVVKGTVYAERIVGDIVAVVMVNVHGVAEGTFGWVPYIRFSIEPINMNRMIARIGFSTGEGSFRVINDGNVVQNLSPGEAMTFLISAGARNVEVQSYSKGGSAVAHRADMFIYKKDDTRVINT